MAAYYIRLYCLTRDELREFGAYRTQRLVLAAWDAMEEVHRGH